VKAIGLEKDQPAPSAKVVHAFERDFATGQITINTPVDPDTGRAPPPLVDDDIGEPLKLTALCGEPPK
jgi:hypothetical protein